MPKSFVLLTLFTAGTLGGAVATNNSSLDFLAFISGIVFLVKSTDLINAEIETRAADRRRSQPSEDEDEG
jgi:hypothetical protein